MHKYWKILWVFVFIIAFVLPAFSSPNSVHADGYEGYGNVSGGDVSKEKDEEGKEESKVKKAQEDKRDEDKEEASTEPEEVEQGGVELIKERYPNSRYFPIVDADGSWWPFSSEEIAKNMNGMTTALFALNKQIVDIVDASLDKFMGLEVIDKVEDTITEASEKMWNVMKEHFAALLLTIAVVQILVYFIAERNGMKAGKASLKLILIFGVATIWISNSGYYLNVLNHWSDQMQGYMMEAGTVLTSDVDEIEEGEEVEGSTALLRNNYFQMTVRRPYLIMNYGTTDEDKIREDDEEGEDRIEDMLAFKTNEDGSKEREKMAEEEVDDKNNHYMDPSSVWNKLGIAVLSIGYSILIGVPLFLLVFVNVLIQFVVLMIAFILPISFIVSILPNFANSGWHSLGRLVSTFLMKVFVSILIIFTFLIFNVVDTLLPPTNVGTYYLNMSMSSLLLIMMIAKRNKIIEFITAGRVISATGQVPGGMYGGARRATNMARRGGGAVRNAGSHTVSKGLAATGIGAAAVSATRRAAQKGGQKLKERKNSRNKNSGGKGQEQKGESQNANVINFSERRKQRQEQEKQGKGPQSKSGSQPNLEQDTKGQSDSKQDTGEKSETTSEKEKSTDNGHAKVAPPSQPFSKKRRNRTNQSPETQSSIERQSRGKTGTEGGNAGYTRSHGKQQTDGANQDSKEQKNNHTQPDTFLSERARRREERRQQKQEKIENKETKTDKIREKSKQARKSVVDKRKARKRKRR